MDKEFFELTSANLQKRYTEILNLHNARLSSNTLELQNLADAKKTEINKLTQQVSTKTSELEKAKKEKQEMRKVAEEFKMQLLAKTAELEKAKEEKLEQREKKLEAENMAKELKQKLEIASEEAKLTLLQLHQVQEEMEHYFIQSRAKDKLLQKHQAQQHRAKKLVSKILKGFRLNS